MENKRSTGIINLGNIVKIISIICIILFFSSSFLVSCGGKTVEISGMDIVKGVKVDTGFSVEKVSNSKPIVLICLFIPIAIIILTLIKKLGSEKLLAGICAVLVLIDIIIWNVIKSNVKETALENNCQFETTGAFTWTIILLVLEILILIMAIITPIGLHSDLRNLSATNISVSSGTLHEGAVYMAESTKQMSKKVSQFAGEVSSSVSGAISNMKGKENIMGYCQKCGAPLSYGNEFCAKCGVPIPKELIEAFEAEKKAKEETERLEEERKAEEAKKVEGIKAEDSSNTKFCPYCGAELSSDAAFCSVCGKKME